MWRKAYGPDGQLRPPRNQFQTYQSLLFTYGSLCLASHPGLDETAENAIFLATNPRSHFRGTGNQAFLPLYSALPCPRLKMSRASWAGVVLVFSVLTKVRARSGQIPCKRLQSGPACTLTASM